MTDVFDQEPLRRTLRPGELPEELPEELMQTGELARRAFRYLDEQEPATVAPPPPMTGRGLAQDDPARSTPPPALGEQELSQLQTIEFARIAFDGTDAHLAEAVPGHAAVPMTRRERAAAMASTSGAYLAESALALAIVALVASFFFGWLLPLALAAVALSAAALRRPAESRTTAIWALALALAATVFSIGWLIWVVVALDLAA